MNHTRLPRNMHDRLHMKHFILRLLPCDEILEKILSLCIINPHVESANKTSWRYCRRSKLPNSLEIVKLRNNHVVELVQCMAACPGSAAPLPQPGPVRLRPIKRRIRCDAYT